MMNIYRDIQLTYSEYIVNTMYSEHMMNLLNLIPCKLTSESFTVDFAISFLAI